MMEEGREKLEWGVGLACQDKPREGEKEDEDFRVIISITRR